MSGRILVLNCGSPTNEEWIAASHAVRKLRKGAHGTTRARAPATPAGSEA